MKEDKDGKWVIMVTLILAFIVVVVLASILFQTFS